MKTVECCMVSFRQDPSSRLQAGSFVNKINYENYSQKTLLRLVKSWKEIVIYVVPFFYLEQILETGTSNDGSKRASDLQAIYIMHAANALYFEY